MGKYYLILKDEKGKQEGSQIEVRSKILVNIAMDQTINYSIWERKGSYKIIDIQRDVEAYEDNLKIKGVEKKVTVIAQKISI